MPSAVLFTSLLALAAILEVSSAAPLPTLSSALESAISQLEPVETIPLPTSRIFDTTDSSSGRNTKRTKTEVTSGGDSEEPSEASGSSSKTSNLVDKIAPFAASWVGENIADEVGSAIGLTSSESTSAADVPTETAASTRKDRRKRTVSSSEENEASSVAGTVWDLGKQFLKDTALSGGSQVAGTYIADNVESAITPSSTTAAASARKRSSEDGDDLLGQIPTNIQDGIDVPTPTVPHDVLASVLNALSPTSVVAQKRKLSMDSTAKQFGVDTVKAGLSSLAGDWLAGEAENMLGMDSNTPTPTAAASRKRSLAGSMAMKTGEKAAGKVFHDERKNKTEGVVKDIKGDAVDLKNKLVDFVSGLGDHGGSNSKILRRSDSGLQASQKRHSIPISEPEGSTSSSLNQRAPQGFLSAAKGLLELAGDRIPDVSGSSEDGNEVVDIGVDVRKRSPGVGSEMFDGLMDGLNLLTTLNDKRQVV